jgi:hypothetical protein
LPSAVCAAPAAGLTLDSLKQAPSAVVGGGAAPKDVRVVREWAGAVCRDAGHEHGVAMRNLVPTRYNDKSELTFDVPPGGTSQANFDRKAP